MRTLRERLLVVLLAGLIAACGAGEDRDGREDPLSAGISEESVIDSIIKGPSADTAAGPIHEPPVTGEGAAGERPLGADEAEPLTGRGDEQPSGGASDDGAAQPGMESGDVGGDMAADIAAHYQLAAIEGQDLPVTIGEGPECDLQLVKGDLHIDANLDFEIRTTVHHMCGGERAGEEVHTAEGTVGGASEQLRFDAEYESLFATAYGRRLADGAILIDRLETGGESHAVNWRFLR